MIKLLLSQQAPPSIENQLEKAVEANQAVNYPNKSSLENDSSNDKF